MIIFLIFFKLLSINIENAHSYKISGKRFNGFISLDLDKNWIHRQDGENHIYENRITLFDDFEEFLELSYEAQLPHTFYVNNQLLAKTIMSKKNNISYFYHSRKYIHIEPKTYLKQKEILIKFIFYKEINIKDVNVKLLSHAYSRYFSELKEAVYSGVFMFILVFALFHLLTYFLNIEEKVNLWFCIITSTILLMLYYKLNIGNKDFSTEAIQPFIIGHFSFYAIWAILPYFMFFSFLKFSKLSIQHCHYIFILWMVFALIDLYIPLPIGIFLTFLITNFIYYSRYLYFGYFSNDNSSAQILALLFFNIIYFAALKILSLTSYLSILAICLINIFYVALIKSFIYIEKYKDVNKMNVEIGEINKKLEEKVTIKTHELNQTNNEISAILNALDQGIMTIEKQDSNIIISEGTSKHTAEIFENNDLENTNFFENILNNCDLSENDKSQIKTSLLYALEEDEFNFTANESHLVKELIYLNKKTLTIDWIPILNNKNIIEKIMLIAIDVTKLKELTKKNQEQENELKILESIFKIGVNKFEEYMQNTKILIDEVKNNNDLKLMFRNLHTIKGNSRTLKLGEIINIAHEAEEHLALALRGSALLNTKNIYKSCDLILIEITEFEKIIEKYFQNISSSKSSIIISNVKNIIAYENTSTKQKMDSIYKEVLNNNYVQLTDIIKNEVLNIEALAQELEKESPEIKIESNNIYISKKIETTIRDIFTHLFRNSMDHGIEDTKTRLLLKKKTKGLIHIKILKNKDNLIFQVNDDGRGLNLKLLAKDQTNLSDEEIACKIFESGTSTAKKVSNISGRGVGMDAIRSFVRDKGGDVLLSFISPRENDYRRVCFEIIFPQNYGMIADNQELYND